MPSSLRHHASLCLALIVGACAACSVAPAKAPEAATTQPAEDPTQEQIEAALDRSIILYRITDEPHDVCSGVRVSPTRIVTAYHCVVVTYLPDELLDLVQQLDPMLRNTEIEGLVGSTVWFTWRGADDATRARVIAVDPKHDLAMLATPRSSQPYARVRDGLGVVGEDVFAVGNPLGNEYSYTRGWVSYSCRFENAHDNECWTQTDLTIAPGNSGGGLYDIAGQLMGICSHGYLDYGLNFFTEPRALAKFVEANL